MNKSITVTSLSQIAAISTLAALTTFSAATPATAADETPEHNLAANLNLTSEYRFRGIDQTWGRPALQGGIDYNHASGLYAGLWASNVSDKSYPGGNMEIDYYAGYNGKINDDWGYTVGGYGYWYPGANLHKADCPSAAWSAPCSLAHQKFDNFELNGGISWKWVSYKLSVSTTDYFGANTRTGYNSGTRGTLYHDLTINAPIADDLTLNLHLGQTDVKAMYGSIDPDYTDWKIGLTKNLPDNWTLAGAWIGASNNTFFRPPSGGLSATSNDTRDLNRGRLVVTLGRTF